MSSFEYKAVPAPVTGTKAKGVKTTEDRFALSLTTVLNEAAEDGWEYVRAETLPCDERKGLTGRQTTFQNVLIFRRPKVPAQPRPPAQVAPEGDALPPLTLERANRAPVQRSEPPLQRTPQEDTPPQSEM